MKTHIRSYAILRLEELEPRWLPADCGAATRSQVAAGFVGSVEYLDKSIHDGYQLAFNRPPSREEIQQWRAWMQSQSASPTVIRSILFGSPEFASRIGSDESSSDTRFADEQWLRGVYAKVLGREPEPSGLTVWAQSLLEARFTRQQVARLILTSSESLRRQVTELYVGLLKRTSVQEEVAGWMQVLETGVSLEQVTMTFLASPEYWRLSGNASGWITRLYSDLFQRKPDDAGYKGWVEIVTPVSNPRVNDPSKDKLYQDTQSETAVVHFGHVVVVAMNNSRNFVPGRPSHLASWAISENGGCTYKDMDALPNDPTDPERVSAGDPVLARDKETGTIYLLTVSTGGFFSKRQTELLLYRSFDNGRSFKPPVVVYTGPLLDFADKPWLAIDNAPGAGRGTLIVVWRQFSLNGQDGIWVTTSKDGSASWSFPEQLTDSKWSQGAYVITDKDHRIYVFWHRDEVVIERDALGNNRVTSRTGLLEMRASNDGGITFGNTVTVARLKGTGADGSLELENGTRTASFIQVATHPDTDALYATWNDVGPTNDKGDVFFSQSSDQGKTWSVARKVNDDNTNHVQFSPAIGITNDGRHLLLSWYDARLHGNKVDRYAAIGKVTQEGVTFLPNVRLSDESFPLLRAQDGVTDPRYGIGDYDMLSGGDNDFIVPFAFSGTGNWNVHAIRVAVS